MRQKTYEGDIWLLDHRLTSACMHTRAHGIEQTIVKMVIGILKKDHLKNSILILLVIPRSLFEFVCIIPF